MTNLSHNLTNSPSAADRAAAFDHARALGTATAEGLNSLPALGIYVCDAVQRNVLAPEDAKAIYEAYITSCSNKLEHSDGGKAANTSKLGNFMKLGAMTTVDGVEVLQDAVLAHKFMRDAKIKVKGAYLAYETVAKAQIASKTRRLSKSEIRDLMSKDEKDKGAMDHLKAAAKALEKALSLPQDMTEREMDKAQEALTAVNHAMNMIDNRERRAAAHLCIAAPQHYTINH